MTPDGRYIIAVDFDGTLIKENKWPNVDGVPDRALIKNLLIEQKKGNKLILNTCRTGEALETAVNWCKDQGIEFDAVNDNLPELIEAYGENTRKISADIYIDDRALHPYSVSWSFYNEYAMSITDHWLYNKGGNNA